MSLHRRKPRGAVTFKQARASKGPWYFVDRGHGIILIREAKYPLFVKGAIQAGYNGYFEGYFESAKKRKAGHLRVTVVGWCFLDYFSALAYSLKRKAAWDRD